MGLLRRDLVCPTSSLHRRICSRHLLRHRDRRWRARPLHVERDRMELGHKNGLVLRWVGSALRCARLVHHARDRWVSPTSRLVITSQ
jgi:hypothetical protein